MSVWTAEKIAALLAGFKNQSLTAETWTHEAHLIVAMHFLFHYPPDEALIYLRSGIISLNLRMGVANTPSGGYHETMTCFWAWVTEQYIAHSPKGVSFEELCRRFLKSSCANKGLPLAFFTKDYLFHTQARARNRKPNLQELDPKHLLFD